MTTSPDSRPVRSGGALSGAPGDGEVHGAMAGATGNATSNAAGSVVAGYAPLPGIYDEMMAPDGAVRGHWRRLVDALDAMGHHDVVRRFASAEQHLASSGVFYRVYEDAADVPRAYRLSHVPLLIDSGEWAGIVAGLTQRADLIEAILADVYGPGTLAAGGRLPAAVIAGSPELVRPLVGVAPHAGRHLCFYAADIGRDARGRWWVLRDRTQAPSGSGYALENRIALSRSLPDVYADYGVERLATYFDAVRTELTRHCAPDDAGVCLLSPGPLNEAYFEHVYLSRYLGFRLVEGQDLQVKDRRVHLRTVLGLKPVRVLLRRIDADFADPLELNTRSRLGVPGLVGALRAGSVVVKNALGSGIIEAPAFLSFLPALAPHLAGADLLMPNVATWWCGQEEERRHVLAHLDDLVVGPAFAAAPPGGVTGARLGDAEKAALAAGIARRGVDYVAQEPVHLSTMPVWQGGRLVPRPFVLRVYLVATADGWRVMPGGMALVGDDPADSAPTMQRGAGAADVWVLADGHAEPVSLLPQPEAIAIRRASAALPSRAADNLYWLARYLERAEATVRVVRAALNRLTEQDQEADAAAALAELLLEWGAIEDADAASGMGLLAEALWDRTRPGSVASLVAAGRLAGLAVRTRFPTEGWRALDDIGAMLAHPSHAGEAGHAGVLEAVVHGVLRNLAAISGVELDNMNRLSGWRFLKLGGRIERAILVCRQTRRLGLGAASAGMLDALLELNGSQITYRVRYPHGAARTPVLDLVLMDDGNPRSLAFALERVEEHVGALARMEREAGTAAAAQSASVETVSELMAAFRGLDLASLEAPALVGIENLLMRLSDAVTARYFDLSDGAGEGRAAP